MPTNSPEYYRAYRLKNREKLRKAKKAWYEKNRAKALRYQHEWNRLNRPSKRVLAGRTKTVSGKVRVVLPRNKRRPRNPASKRGQKSD